MRVEAGLRLGYVDAKREKVPGARDQARAASRRERQEGYEVCKGRTHEKKEQGSLQIQVQMLVDGKLAWSFAKQTRLPL